MSLVRSVLASLLALTIFVSTSVAEELLASPVPTMEPSPIPTLEPMPEPSPEPTLEPTPAPTLEASPSPSPTPIEDAEIISEPASFSPTDSGPEPSGENVPFWWLPEDYQNTGEEESTLVYQDILCTYSPSAAEAQSIECALSGFASYTYGSDGAGVSNPPVQQLNQGAQCPDVETAVGYLNDVRRRVCESNRWPNGFQRWQWQWNARKLWHIARQGQADRTAVLNGNNALTPNHWMACGNQVLDHRDAFGQSWGNCAEQASTLAAMIYTGTCLWVRVCYQNGHAWTEISNANANPGNGPIFWLDPWGDGAGNGATAGSQCTNWFRRKADGTWENVAS